MNRGPLVLGGALLLYVLLSDPREELRAPLARLVRWPLDPAALTRVGDEPGAGRGHQGLDLFAPAGTPVRAPAPLQVVRIVNGNADTRESARRAGQWVDAKMDSGWQLRFLHLREQPPVTVGQRLAAGDVLGAVADAGTSGLHESPPHLHFEVRQPPRRGEIYGPAVNPLAVLPPLGRAAVDARARAARERLA